MSCYMRGTRKDEILGSESFTRCLAIGTSASSTGGGREC